MEVLSMWQPYAHALCIGAKQNETRSRDTKFRGLFLIHATLKQFHQLPIEIQKHLTYNSYISDIYPLRRNIIELDRGAIIGAAELYDTRQMEGDYPMYSYTPKERAFGDFSKGRWVWHCKNHILFKQAYPCKGKQAHFFDCPEGILKEIQQNENIQL